MKQIQVPIHQTEMMSALAGSSAPLYVQAYQYMKREIIADRWLNQARLPSVRKLAELLGISTTPVEMAYQQLLAEGFIVSRPRSGYFVQTPDDIFPLPAAPPPTNGPKLKRHHHFPFDFHMSKNEYRHFPVAAWRKAYSRCLQEECAAEMLFYGDPQGEEGLRREIAAYAKSVRGVQCTPEQVIIGSDPYPLLDIICRLLRPYGDRVGVENPGYPQYPEAFRQNGFQVMPLAVHEDGIRHEDLQGSGVKLVTVSPSHQFPTGVTMPISRRLALLQWAHETEGFIIEDDYDGEFRYYGRPIPCLQGLRSDGRVIYMSGFSQVLSPAIGVHYMILPAVLLPAYHHLKFHLFLECTASRLQQLALERFMKEGYVDRHLRKMRMLLRKKHDRLIASIQRYFGERAVISGNGAGFHLMLSITHPLSAHELETLAEHAGIRVSAADYTWLPDTRSCTATDRRSFIVGFGGLLEEEIDEGMKRLASCWLST